MATEEANLTPSEIQTLKEIANSVDSDTDIAQLSEATGISRRDILKIGAALGVGSLVGGTTASEVIGEARAAADTSDSDGNVGLPGDRVDVFAEGIDANQIGTSSNRITDLFGDSVDANSVSTVGIATSPNDTNDVFGNRQANTTYQNTEGKDIDVAVVTASDGTADAQAQHRMLVSPDSSFSADDVVARPNTQASTAVLVRVSSNVTVPDGYYYQVDVRSGSIESWNEMY